MAPNMVKKRDEESGRYTETVSDAEIVEFVRDSAPVGTADVAAEFGYERPSAYRRLKGLEEEGDLVSQQIGNSLLWEPKDSDE